MALIRGGIGKPVLPAQVDLTEAWHDYCADMGGQPVLFTDAALIDTVAQTDTKRKARMFTSASSPAHHPSGNDRGDGIAVSSQHRTQP